MSLFGNNPYQSGGGGFNFRLILGLLIAVGSVIAYYSHKSVNPVTGETQYVQMTQKQEIQLGLQSAPAMEQQYQGDLPRDNPEAQEVRYIGNLVAQRSDASRSGYPFQYHLLADTETVNAFALPGGQVFITKALYDKLADEAELAGVLGHETGHVVERHSAQQVEQAQLGNRLTAAVAVGSRDNTIRNGVAAEVVNKLTQLHFSRGDESQADEEGVKFMTEAGFDPRAMIDVMKVLMSVSKTGPTPEFLVTHPFPESRIKAINEQLEQMYPHGAPGNLTRGRALPH